MKTEEKADAIEISKRGAQEMKEKKGCVLTLATSFRRVHSDSWH